MAKDHLDRVALLRRKLTLVNTSLVNAANQLKNGKVVAASIIDELTEQQDLLQRHIKQLEDGTAEAAATVSSSEPVSPSPDTGEAGASLEDDTGTIPERILVRPRKYTMSEAALKQRQDAANSPAKPDAMRGNANAWKTGEFAHSRIKQIFRPCLSTCPKHPCDLIDEGETAPGSVCLDKQSFVKSLAALQKAMQTGDLTDAKDLAALQIAGGMEVVSLLIDDIVTLGTLIKSEKWGKDGIKLGYEIKNNPSLLPLAKLMEVLNLSPAEMLITPREVARQKVAKKKAIALSNLMSGLGIGEAPDEDAEVERPEEE